MLIHTYTHIFRFNFISYKIEIFISFNRYRKTVTLHHIIATMRPLKLVKPTDLILGRTYLIQEKRPEYAHQKFKGTFIKNDYPRSPVYCTITHFTNVICRGNHSRKDLAVQDLYWNYYEADAVTLAYTAHILHEITGDSSFMI